MGRRAAGVTVAVDPGPGQQWGVQRTVVRIVHQGLGFGFTISESATRAANPNAGTSWSQPRWLHAPTGRLQVKLGSDYTRGVADPRATFADGASRTAEDKVGELLDEIQRRARTEHTRQREEQRLDELYAQQRAVAVSAARDRLWDDVRATAALEQAQKWQTAQQLRAFAAAIRSRGIPGDGGWLDWIEVHANHLDPPDQAPLGPALPDSPNESSDLAPYLKGWPSTRPRWWSPPPGPPQS